MLPLKDKDRVRVLAGVARKGATWQVTRVTVVTLSLAILVIVPLSKLVRIDLWGGEHYLLGERVTTVKALGGFIVSMAILYGATFLSNMIVGRFFCGWGCPVGYVSRLGEGVQNTKSRGRRFFSHFAGAGFVGTFVAAVMLWWVDPRVLIDGSPKAVGITIAVFGVLCLGGFFHAFGWRFGFCVNVCPIGLYYRYVTSRAPISILFSQVPDPCIECGACEKICPVNIDPKNLGALLPDSEATSVDDEPERYGDAECIRCGDCIEACRMIFANTPEAVPPLRFGRPGDIHQDQASAVENPASDPGATEAQAARTPRLEATRPVNH